MISIGTVICPSDSTVTYARVTYLMDVLSPLVDKTEHRVKNLKEFVEYVKNLNVGPDEELRSYGVSALFTSISVNKAMDVIRRQQLEDESLRIRTPLSPNDHYPVGGSKCTYILPT